MFKAQYLLYSIALGLIVLGTFPIILPTHITLGITVFVLLLTTSELIESVLEYKEPTEDDITLGERINNNALELFYFLSQMLMYASVPLAIFFLIIRIRISPRTHAIFWTIFNVNSFIFYNPYYCPIQESKISCVTLQ